MKDNKILKKGEIKLVVFADGEKEKDKIAKILDVDEYGISIEYWDITNNKSLGVPAIFLPWHKVNKIKDVRE